VISMRRSICVFCSRGGAARLALLGTASAGRFVPIFGVEVPEAAFRPGRFDFLPAICVRPASLCCALLF